MRIWTRWNKCGPCILYFADQIHCKDGTKEHLSSQPLGEGQARFKQQVAFLKDKGYTGWFIIENFYNEPAMRSHNPGDVLALLADDVRRMKEALA